jgi:hypothetical protein
MRLTPDGGKSQVCSRASLTSCSNRLRDGHTKISNKHMRSRSVELRDPGVHPALSSSDSSSSDDETGDEGLPQPAITTSNDIQDDEDAYKWRRRFVRALALICAMSLSIGSHL